MGFRGPQVQILSPRHSIRIQNQRKNGRRTPTRTPTRVTQEQMVAPNRPHLRRIPRPSRVTPRLMPYATGEFPAELGTVGRPLTLTVKQPLAVRPVVVDSNVLRHEVRRALR